MNATPKRIDINLKRFLSIRRVGADWENSNSEVTSKTSAVIANHKLKSVNEKKNDNLTRPRA